MSYMNYKPNLLLTVEAYQTLKTYGYNIDFITQHYNVYFSYLNFFQNLKDKPLDDDLPLLVAIRAKKVEILNLDLDEWDKKFPDNLTCCVNSWNAFDRFNHFFGDDSIISPQELTNTFPSCC